MCFLGGGGGRSPPNPGIPELGRFREGGGGGASSSTSISEFSSELVTSTWWWERVLVFIPVKKGEGLVQEPSEFCK